MYAIPPKGSDARVRMIKEHRACIDHMRGVAGCSILRTERPGSAIEPYGGIHEYMDLAKVLVRMRAMQPGTSATATSRSRFCRGPCASAAIP